MLLVKAKLFNNNCSIVLTTNAQEELRRLKISIKPLKRTNLGLVRTLFDRFKITLKRETIAFVVNMSFFQCTLKVPLKAKYNGLLFRTTLLRLNS